MSYLYYKGNKIPKEKIEEAIQRSTNYKELIDCLGLKNNRYSYNIVKKFIEDNKLDLSHFRQPKLSENRDIESVKDAVNNSYSIRETLIKLDLAPYGGNYKCLRRVLEEYNIDTSHFLGKAAKTKKISSNRIGRRPVDEYLVLNPEIKITTYKLKNRLIAENYFEKKCYRCNTTKWQGYEVPLELEHINGNHNDFRFENLTLLCPNCHALTETYRGRNKY